jgi:DNA-binding transcriptional MocR family regulator
MWLPNLDGRNRPVYRAIADAIDEDVQSGALRAGARLPPHRDLADHLGVTVTTITRAYTEAARRGLTSGHVGRGTFIRGAEPDDDAGLLDLSINILMPDQEVLNLQPHLFQRRVLPWTQLFGYAPKRGHARHRQILAGWLADQGLVTHPDHIVPTAGAQHGLAVTFQTLLEPGATLLMEDVTYSGARLLAERMRLKLRPVAMDGEGLRPDALDAACRATKARVLYCMPRLQNPTSAIMSEKRRRQIAALAAKYQLTVIEDDVYGFASPERTPLAALIPERTLFVTSLSKSLLPGLRVGCVVAPPAMIERLVAAVWATMVMVSPVGVDLACSWIEDGTAARIADWKRREIAARQVMARRLLQHERLQTQPSSPHVWLLLPARWTPETFVASLRARGVVVNSSTEFAVADPAPRTVRVCLGTPRTRAGLEQALGRVVEVLGERVPAARVVV